MRHTLQAFPIKGIILAEREGFELPPFAETMEDVDSNELQESLRALETRVLVTNRVTKSRFRSQNLGARTCAFAGHWVSDDA